MLTYDVELVELEAQPTAVVRAHVTVPELPAFLGGVFGDVITTLGEQRLEPAGPPFGRYVPCEDGFEVEAGFPTAAPITAAGRVLAGSLPGGTAARVLHRGSYDAVAAAYDAAAEWVASHGYIATGPPWECYLDPPEVAEPRTLVYLPCRPA